MGECDTYVCVYAITCGVFLQDLVGLVEGKPLAIPNPTVYTRSSSDRLLHLVNVGRQLLCDDPFRQTWK